MDFRAQCSMNVSEWSGQGAAYVEQIEAEADAVLGEGPPGSWDLGHEKGQCHILSHYG